MLSSVQKRLAAGLKAILPIAVTQRLQAWWQDAAIRRLLLWPPFGAVASHDLLRRTSPISRLYGADRGTVIDRYYIENFLARHANDVRGVVLEIQAFRQEPRQTKRGTECVTWEQGDDCRDRKSTRLNSSHRCI